jgi:hypothetical protein
MVLLIFTLHNGVLAAVAPHAGAVRRNGPALPASARSGPSEMP